MNQNSVIPTSSYFPFVIFRYELGGSSGPRWLKVVDIGIMVMQCI